MTDTYDRPSIAKIERCGVAMTPADIANVRQTISDLKGGSASASEEWILDGWSKSLDALEHAIHVDGDHLSIASRRMVDTVLGERDALRQRVRDLEKAIDGVLGESDPYIETPNFRALRSVRTVRRTR